MISRIILLSTIIFLSSQFVFAFGGGKRTPRKTPGFSRTGSAPYTPYGRILTGLEQLRESNPSSVNCNQTYESTARALICTCANEAGIEKLSGKVAVLRVVFSRAKSTAFPNSIRQVVCQKSQFSYINGGFDRNCNRIVPRKAPYLNSPIVREPMLSQCYMAAAEAAKIEFQERPNDLFFLNYASTNHRAYRAYGSAMPRWVRNCINRGNPREGSHIFCNAAAGYASSSPKNNSSSVIVYFYESVLKFLSNTAHAIINDTKITNTKSKQKLILDEKIKAILKEKYPNFKPYNFKDFTKPSRKLMTGLRNNLPMAIKGNFDGNSADDIILMGTDENKAFAIAFLFNERGMVTSQSVYEFESLEPGKAVDSYLVKIPKSKIQHSVGESRDALQVEKFGGVAVPILFDGKKFVRNNPKTGFLFNEQVEKN